MTEQDGRTDAVLAEDLAAVAELLDVLGADESAAPIWEACRRLAPDAEWGPW